MNDKSIISHPRIFDKLTPELVSKVVDAIKKCAFPRKRKHDEDRRAAERERTGR